MATENKKYVTQEESAIVKIVDATASTLNTMFTADTINVYYHFTTTFRGNTKIYIATPPSQTKLSYIYFDIQTHSATTGSVQLTISSSSTPISIFSIPTMKVNERHLIQVIGIGNAWAIQYLGKLNYQDNIT